MVGPGLLGVWGFTLLSTPQLLLAVAFVYGVPTAIWAVRRLVVRMRADRIEARVLTPLTPVYLVSVLGCVAMSALKVGQTAGADGSLSMWVEWCTTVTVFLFGTARLVGSAFILARNMPPHNVYKIYYLSVLSPCSSLDRSQGF